MTNIPIIDLCSLKEPDRSRQIRIAKELRDALRQSGFFIITNHGITEPINGRDIIWWR